MYNLSIISDLHVSHSQEREYRVNSEVTDMDCTYCVTVFILLLLQGNVF